MSPPLLIIGASARAAAQSAVRAGFCPITIDLFADRDLAALGQAFSIGGEHYPERVVEVATGVPPCPWIYTGGLENRPDLIDNIAESRPLLGIQGQALESVRNPFRWTSTLRSADFNVLEVHHQSNGSVISIERDSAKWLRKQVASAGGRGVSFRSGEKMSGETFLQEYIKGEPLGATFLRNGTSIELVGVVQAFTESQDDKPFIYAGGIGPIALSEGQTAILARIGQVLAASFDLTGLFGVDFIHDARGKIWPIEINPRYSASMELIERVTGRALLAEHAQAFGVECEPMRPKDLDRPVFAAKRIIYAETSVTVPKEWPWTDIADPLRDVADIPVVGASILPADPVLTVFARGSTYGETMKRLDAITKLWRGRIASWAVKSAS